MNDWAAFCERPAAGDVVTLEGDTMKVVVTIVGAAVASALEKLPTPRPSPHADARPGP
jgi:hypothetical protein